MMQAVILMAGYGSRLKRDDIPHKCLLPFGDETLLSRHLSILQTLGIERTVLVVGHNKEAVKHYAQSQDLSMPVEFVDNDRYETTGNTLSLVMGLRDREGDLLVMDGDVLYPRAALEEYVRQSRPSSFAVTPVDIDDTEATKVLLRADQTIESFVTKRDLTPEEKSKFHMAGEAIGFFMLTQTVARNLVTLYDQETTRFTQVLWEIIFNEITPHNEIHPYPIPSGGCIEIDTQGDYEKALRLYQSQPEKYCKSTS
jgi:choline kinase